MRYVRCQRRAKQRDGIFESGKVVNEFYIAVDTVFYVQAPRLYQNRLE